MKTQLMTFMMFVSMLAFADNSNGMVRLLHGQGLSDEQIMTALIFPVALGVVLAFIVNPRHWPGFAWATVMAALYLLATHWAGQFRASGLAAAVLFCAVEMLLVQTLVLWERARRHEAQQQVPVRRPSPPLRGGSGRG